jgi:hypothetical protein
MGVAKPNITNQNPNSQEDDVSASRAAEVYRKTAIGYGLFAGLLMGLYLLLTSSYINGNHAGVAFMKYLILGGFIGQLLYRFKRRTPAGKTFKYGIGVGATLTLTAALTLAVSILILNGFGEATTIKTYFSQSENDISSYVLAGVSFFECLVAGMILTFIFLQSFKEGKPAE